jgi:ketosteroid isomerase-like protein
MSIALESYGGRHVRSDWKQAVNSSAIFNQFFAAMQRGDLAAQAALLHPDFVVSEANGLPYGGEYRGEEGWRAFNRIVARTWDQFHVELKEVAAEGSNTLVVVFAIGGRSRRTGKSFDTTVMELWRFADGKVREIVPYYWDTHQLHIADESAT